jgi:hypothetical protein
MARHPRDDVRKQEIAEIVAVKGAEDDRGRFVGHWKRPWIACACRRLAGSGRVGIRHRVLGFLLIHGDTRHAIRLQGLSHPLPRAA